MTDKIWVLHGLVPAALFIARSLTWLSRVRRRSADLAEPQPALAEEGVSN